MAFLAGLVKGAAREDKSPNPFSADLINHSPLDFH